MKATEKNHSKNEVHKDVEFVGKTKEEIKEIITNLETQLTQQRTVNQNSSTMILNMHIFTEMQQVILILRTFTKNTNNLLYFHFVE